MMNRILPVALVILFLIEGGILNANIPKSQHIQKVLLGPQKNFFASLAECLPGDIRNSYSSEYPKAAIASSVTIERDETNALLKRYTYGNGIDEQVAQEYKTNNGLVTVLPMYDSTGNMIGVTDDTGKLLEKYSYSTFGMPEFGYDFTPPKINSIYIGDGMFITNFSEPVNIGTVTNGMKVKHEGVVLQGTFETGAGGKEIKFIPAAPLQPGQISVDIAETVEDEAGNQMENSSSYTVIYSGAITIVHDDSAPEVDRIEKSSNDFIVIFSERIDPYTTVDSIKIKKADRSISGSITTIDERTIKFTPDEVLAANQEYMLWVNSTIKDLSGKSLNLFFHEFMVMPDDFLVYEKPDPNNHVYSRIGNNYLFHGREYEPEVGLYNYRNRYYMPRIGRFLQTDPTGYLDSMNLYQAFGMNPVNFLDPFGLDTDAGRIASSLNKTYGRKDITWKDIDNALTEMSNATRYMVEGTINLGLGLIQGTAHLLNTLANPYYANYDWRSTQIDINSNNLFIETVDTRPAVTKVLGNLGGDLPAHLYQWGKSGINMMDENLAPSERREYMKQFFRGLPGVIILGRGLCAPFKSGGPIAVQLGDSVAYQYKPFINGRLLSEYSYNGTTVRILENKAAGDAFENWFGEKIMETRTNVRSQITVKTQSGVKTRLDFICNKGPNDTIQIFEAKASSTAPLTTNQKIAFPIIEIEGATILGEGKPPFTGGYEIPPTKVIIIRNMKKKK